MNVPELLFFGALAGGLPAAQATGPSQEPADTTRLTTGAGGAAFAWGTVVLRSGERLHAYLPAGATGAEFTLPYYLAPPDRGHPAPKAKHLALSKVQSMLVRGQYSELLPGDRSTPGQRTPDRLGARLAGGAVALFVVKSPAMLAVSFLGSSPVLSAPVSTTATALLPEATSYYLRRAGSAPVRVEPALFATQLATFLADDKELAHRILSGQAGYRFADLPSLVQQYNQHARP